MSETGAIERKDTALISVIVPVYNVERYVSRCIESIIAQSYKHFEVILVDDGSTDSSGGICDEYAKKDTRIKVLHQQNGGLSAARNAGMAAAQGAYYSFVDSDDMIDRNFLESLYACIIRDNADLAVCGFRCEDEDGGILYEQRPPRTLPAETNALQRALLDELALVVVWNKLYLAEIFEDLSFREGKQHEDEFIMHYIMDRVRRVSCTESELYHYIMHDESITNAKSSLRKFDAIEALYDRFLFYAGRRYDNLLPILIRMNTDNYLRIIHEHGLTSGIERARAREATRYIRKMENVLPMKTKLKNRTKRFMRRYVPTLYSFLRKIRTKGMKREVMLRYVREGRRPCFLLIDTPQHGNVGDQAIALAEKEWLAKVFGEKSFYEITANEIDGIEDRIASRCPLEQVILVHGGGFLGCLWPNEEHRLRRILAAFRDHKVVILPQTATFDLETSIGRGFFEESKRAYSAHSNLTICLRERNSYNFLKKCMPQIRTLLIPDFVLTMEPDLEHKQRQGILLCMRHDHEKALDDGKLNQFKDTLRMLYPSQKLIETDTVVDYDIDITRRRFEVCAKLDEFSRAALVVTDRLHGMVFAALTGTPCVALDNCNGKVRAVYEWIEQLSYVRYATSLEEAKNALTSLWDATEERVYDSNGVNRFFAPLEALLREGWE